MQPGSWNYILRVAYFYYQLLVSQLSPART